MDCWCLVLIAPVYVYWDMRCIMWLVHVVLLLAIGFRPGLHWGRLVMRDITVHGNHLQNLECVGHVHMYIFINMLHSILHISWLGVRHEIYTDK